MKQSSLQAKAMQGARQQRPETVKHFKLVMRGRTFPKILSHKYFPTNIPTCCFLASTVVFCTHPQILEDYMGAPIGNTNRLKGASLLTVLQAECARDGSHRLRQGVRTLLSRFAKEGNRLDAEFLRDSLDGRPGQQLSITGNSEALTSLQVLFVQALTDRLQSNQQLIPEGVTIEQDKP